MDKPCRQTLVTSGERLAAEASTLASQYHIRSDQHETLEYEASVLKAHVAFLVSGNAIPTHLATSPLLRVNFGGGLVAFTQRVRSWYADFEAYGER